MSDLRRVAIVTGAAGGIGRALVSGLLGAGVRVAAVAGRARYLSPRAACGERAGRSDAGEGPGAPAKPGDCFAAPLMTV